MAKLGKKLGIYTQEEINSDVFSQKYEFSENGERGQFWERVADGPPYVARTAKASYFRDPLLRVMHQIISHTVAGRKDSSGNCPTPDLRWLYHIYEGANFNLAALMAEYFMNSGGKTPQSEICGGEYDTVLARRLGLLTPEVIDDLTLVKQGCDINV